MPRKRAGKSRSRSSKTTARKVKTGKRKSLHTAKATSVLVINMIPKSLTGETNQDSEPTIAVNPANPLQIAASAFTPDPLKGSFAPIIVYQRNANWTTNTLLGVDNTKPVGISIDPFFFKVTG